MVFLMVHYIMWRGVDIIVDFQTMAHAERPFACGMFGKSCSFLHGKNQLENVLF